MLHRSNLIYTYIEIGIRKSDCLTNMTYNECQVISCVFSGCKCFSMKINQCKIAFRDYSSLKWPICFHTLLRLTTAIRKVFDQKPQQTSKDCQPPRLILITCTRPHLS